MSNCAGLRVFHGAAVFENGAYCGRGHYMGADPRLASLLSALFAAHGVRAVADFGAGPGGYAKVFQERGFNVTAYDAWSDRPAHVHYLDLSQPHPELAAAFDATVTLEVGEHVPRSGEANVLDTAAASSTNLVVLSWAPPDQGGIGHVNRKPQPWVKEQLERRDLRLLPRETAWVRNGSSFPHFRRSVMVFERRRERRRREAAAPRRG